MPLTAANGRPGVYTVALFNLANAPATVTATWTGLGIPAPGRASVRDLWSHTDLGVFPDAFSATVPAHGARLLRVRTTPGDHIVETGS